MLARAGTGKLNAAMVPGAVLAKESECKWAHVAADQAVDIGLVNSMTRKRNNKCRNSICACTGACFVDDGTGDFAPKNALGFPIPQNLIDFMVEDIMEMSDEEIIQEAIEELGRKEAVEAEAERVRVIIQKAIERSKGRRQQTAVGE